MIEENNEEIYNERIYDDLFYLYSPIPLEKREASIVISRILRTNNFKFKIGENVDFNETFKDDSVNRMRFKDYFDRLRNSGDQRGFSVEGFMSGVFMGDINNIRRDSWDYVVDGRSIQQKHIEGNDGPRIVSYKEVFNSLNEDLKNELKKYCDEKELNYEELRSQLFTYELPEQFQEIKKIILEARIAFDFLIVSTFEDDRLCSYIIPKEKVKELCLNPKNVRKGKSAYDLRLSRTSITEEGKKFEILKPTITKEEYNNFLNMDENKDKISKIFGKFSSKIRPDILDWIASQPEEFLKNAQSIVDDIIRMREIGGIQGEMGEQAQSSPENSATPPPAPGPYPTVTKWETGLTRGSANPINPKQKWSDVYNIKRGKANTIDPKSKWTTGLNRGKGNTLL